MALPPDDFDELPPEDDPVVRMPKRMYVPPGTAPASEMPGATLIVAIAGACAALGGALGAIGLGIVWATRQPVVVSRTVRVEVAPAAAPVDAAPTPSFALEADAAVEPPPPTGPVYDVAQQRIGAGRTLFLTLRALLVSPADAQAAIRQLQTLVNMRTLQPTDRIAALRDPVTRELRRIEFRRDETQVWAAIREPEGWRSERVRVVLTSSRRSVGLRVGASLNASLSLAQLQPDLAPRLAEVFPAMGLPPRVAAGDVVRLVVDEERLNNQFYRYGRVHAVDYRGAYGHRRAFWVGTGNGRGDFFDGEGHTFERGPLHTPVPNARLSSLFNPLRMHPVLHVLKPHNGIDLAAPADTPIYAAADGTLVSAADSGASGNLVLVQHPRLGVQTGYAHMARFAPGLRPGMHVHAGMLLGYVGSTGRSTGPHLHFSTRRGARFVDPLTLMGIRRTLAQEARVVFDPQVTELRRALDRIAVDGVTLLEGGAREDVAVDAGSHSALPPLEVAPSGVESEPRDPEREDEEPQEEEGERAW